MKRDFLERNSLVRGRFWATFLVVLTTFLTVFSASSQAANSCKALLSEGFADQENKPLYAIHATRQFPEGGILSMASYPVGLVRLTIHFALGHMVYPHFGGSWEEMPMAILVPVKDLRAQLINVNSEDSFIVGDLVLPAGSLLVVREDIEIPDGFNIRVVRYSRDMSLRSAVESIIGGRQQPVPQSNEFWKSIGLSDQQMSRSHHQHSPFEHLERLLFEAMEPIVNQKSQDIFVKEMLTVNLRKIKKSLVEIDQQIADLRLSEIALQSLREARLRAHNYLQLLEAEEILFSQYHKTFRPLLHIYGLQLLELSSSPIELRQFILSHLNEWPLERSFR